MDSIPNNPDRHRQQRAEARETQNRSRTPLPRRELTLIPEIQNIQPTDRRIANAQALNALAGNHGIFGTMPSDQQALQMQQQAREVSYSERANIEKPSPLDNIKTLPELLELIPPEYHKTIIRADERAEKAFDTAKNRERKKPKELVDFVKEYYNIKDYSVKGDRSFIFESKEYKDNNMGIELDSDTGVLRSDYGFRENKEDKVYFSDIQRYACITDNYNEIPIKEYHSDAVTNDNTLKIATALYYANVKLSPDKVTDTVLDKTLKLTKGSAAFKVFLGTDINLSKIFLASDLGQNIQSMTIEKASGVMIRSQLKFVPDEQNL